MASSPQHSARFLAGVADPGRFPLHPYPEIAFAGRSNVGKSSLINRLVGQKSLARVSKTPGRTQQINLFLVDERLVFADLPGYGFARVPIAVKEEWKVLVEHYLMGRAALRAVVVIVDLRRGLEGADVDLLTFLHGHHVDPVIVATKADKLAYAERLRLSRNVDAAAAPFGATVVVCSAATGAGISDLWAAIDDRCAGNEARR